MTARAEIPETVITPEANTCNNCRFDVRFDGRISPPLYWIVILVSPQRGTRVSDDMDMYVEVWDETKPLAALNVARAEPGVIPASLMRETDKGIYFLLKLDKGSLDRSWGTTRANEEHACVIRFADWFKADGDTP
jgi:hypothetical protein